MAARAEGLCMLTGRDAYELAGEVAGGVEAGKCVGRTWLRRWKCPCSRLGVNNMVKRAW